MLVREAVSLTTIYTVQAATLNLRPHPKVIGQPDRQVPRGTLLVVDTLVVGDGPQIVGYDDPSTPQPANVSRHWAHVVGYTLPDGRTVPGLNLYAALAWLEELHEVPPAPTALTFVAHPRITPLRFNRVLREAHSPAANAADACFGIVCDYGLDPAVALAFFKHESSFGNDGVAVRTRNWGNLRKGQGHAAKTLNGWAWYDRWEDGLMDWCILIRDRYVGRGLTTVDLAIPVYAPSSDNNKPDRYIAAIYAAVASWQEKQ